MDKFGFPGSFRWSGEDEYTKEEIIISSILTQNTSWKNVEKAMNNLRKSGKCSLEKISKIKTQDLEDLIRPAGFSSRKARSLKNLADFILSKGKKYFAEKNLESLRSDLLKIYGVGEKTADCILLYVVDRETFVVDSYTRRFVKKYLGKDFFSYTKLKRFFVKNLPCDLGLYKNYHALIVLWGKAQKN